MWSLPLSALTIGQHAGLPGLQDLVELLPKALVARVTEQVILSAFGMKMLKETQKNTI